MLDHDATVAPSEGEDVLLSEARIVSEPKETWEPVARPFPAGNFDPRTAIFRARELHLQKLRAKAAAEREMSVAVQSNENANLGRSQDNLPHAVEQAQGADAPGVGTTRSVPDHRADSGAHPDATETRSERVEDAAPPAPRSSWGWEEPVFDSTADREYATRNQFELQSALEQPESEEFCLPEVAVADDMFATAPVTRPEHSDRELPAWFRADLPRVCRTCRDFRPATDGQRGWCGNAWAFTHRQLVDEDDAAPCRSAIGDWWAPVDDVWLVAADVSAHSRATPLLDRSKAPGPGQRRRS